jgi:hypothetical protein
VLDDDSRVGSQAASVSACDFRPIHLGIGDLLEPLFGNVSANWPRTLADNSDCSVPGASVEDGLCHDEVEQSYPRIGDDGYGLVFLTTWQFDLELLSWKDDQHKLRGAFRDEATPMVRSSQVGKHEAPAYTTGAKYCGKDA